MLTTSAFRIFVHFLPRTHCGPVIIHENTLSLGYTYETKSVYIGALPDVLHQPPAEHTHRDKLGRSGSNTEEGDNV